MDHQLLSLGINNIVINPTDIPTTQKELFQKSDSIDCRKIARGLHAKELTPIHVMSRQTLEDRSLVRTRSSGYYPVKEPGEIIPLFSWDLHSGRIHKKEWALEQKVYKMVERRTHSSLLIRERSFELFDFERGKSIRKSQRY